MDLSAIKIVLVNPSHPGNIGATARAMKTMGFSQLVLVQPKAFPHQTATDLASGAEDVLEQAEVVSTLQTAIHGCHMVFATSARPREISLPGMKPEVCARLLGTCSNDTQVAILFGRERTGLTNDELLQANYHICIPTNPAYSALNLSQAVQIIAYELRKNLLSSEVKTSHQETLLATADEVEGLQEHIEQVMVDVDFLKPSNPKRLPQKVRRLFSRIGLETNEVNILRGFLTQIQKKI